MEASIVAVPLASHWGKHTHTNAQTDKYSFSSSAIADMTSTGTVDTALARLSAFFFFLAFMLSSMPLQAFHFHPTGYWVYWVSELVWVKWLCLRAQQHCWDHWLLPYSFGTSPAKQDKGLMKTHIVANERHTRAHTLKRKRMDSVRFDFLSSLYFC